MIELPDWAVPNAATVSMLDYGGWLKPSLGGAAQRLNRMGSRCQLQLSYPPMPSKDKGRILVSRLIRAMSDTVLIDYPLLGFKPGAPGEPRINGAGQAGKLLICDGFTPHYAIREGQPFSLIHNGRRYVHFVDGGVEANAAGQATITISPMLRISPANDAVLEFARPRIEGMIVGDQLAWQMGLEHNFGISFAVEEVA